ncbi:Protein TSSC4 [Portunus trituberculatus]|uniref:Protein TSSC4 n=1 Tax=Portunus trituberculatus TaxID=210409 RepID=A0A5B7E751_PORTR|nr:Protein TSSC4 [Portunus trituberculatus]
MSSFKLQSGDTEFNTRVDALFSSLQTAAKDLEPQLKRKHEEAEQEEEEIEDDREKQPFRRPQGRPPLWRGRGGRGRGRGPRNSTPDYIKNPQKWTQYNMRDTRVLSDSENKREGLKLLADLEARTDKDNAAADQDMDFEEDPCPKIIFKKPSVSSFIEPKYSKSAEDKAEEEVMEKLDTEFGASKKFVMPEYVVGKKKPKSKGKLTDEDKVIEEREKKEVKLSYLMFEEED